MKAEVTAVYKVQGHQTGKHQINGFGELDLDHLTLSDAEALHKAGCPIFEKKSKAEKAEAKAVESGK